MHTLSASIRALLCTVIVSLFATPTWADGDLDTSFGKNGVVRIEFPNASHGYLRDVAVFNGALEAAGFETATAGVDGCSFPNLLIVTLSLTGDVIDAPRSVPQRAIECPSSLIVDSTTGNIFVAGFAKTRLLTTATAIAVFDSVGKLKGTFSFHGRGAEGPWPFCSATRLLLDNEGRLVAPCGQAGGFGFQGLGPLRLSVQDTGLTGGFLGVSGFGYHYASGIVIARDPSSGAYYFAVVGSCQFASSCGTRPKNSVGALVMRFNSDSGEADRNYGIDGVAVVPWASTSDRSVSSITLDGSGNVLIGGHSGGKDAGLASSGYIARLDPTGTLDGGFGSEGVVQVLGDTVVDLLTDKRNRIYVLGASQLLRFSVDGIRNASFSSRADVKLLNGPGSSWHSMQFADSTRSSVYLVGGASCATSCTTEATSGVIAKVILLTNLPSTATTIALNASATTIDSGVTVTFSAVVSGAEPTGSVTFKDGSTVLATVNLTAASASYSTSGLAVGEHSITAVYSGDDDNLASTSQLVTETVNGAPPPPSSAGSGGGGPVSLLELYAWLMLTLWRAAARLARGAIHGRPLTSSGLRAEGIHALLMITDSIAGRRRQHRCTCEDSLVPVGKVLATRLVLRELRSDLRILRYPGAKCVEGA